MTEITEQVDKKITEDNSVEFKEADGQNPSFDRDDMLIMYRAICNFHFTLSDPAYNRIVGIKEKLEIMLK